MAQLEAVLFVGRESLSSRKIAQLAGLAAGAEARTLIRRLNRLYDVGGSAFRVEEVAGGFQLLSRPKFGPWLRRLLQIPLEARLSAPAMETLAVVAYRQPVLRTEIESVRGVQCGDILRQLMERDLVRMLGRADDLGRPLLYGTTKRFLELFGLKHLEDLPRAAEFRALAGTSPSVEDATHGDDDKNIPGAGRTDEISPTDRISEEEAVTTRIRPAPVPEEHDEEALLTPAQAARRHAAVNPIAAADEDADEEEDEEETEDEDEDDWEDDEDEDFEDEEDDDDFVDEEWEEVDDEDLDEDDEEDDEEFEDDDEEEWEEDDDDEDDDEEEDEEWEDDE